MSGTDPRGVRQISAPVVVSNADIKRTYFDMVGREHMNGRLRRKIENLRMVMPMFTVYTGLDIDLAERMPNANLWWIPEIDTEKLYQRFTSDLPRAPSLYIRSGSLRDPSHKRAAPPGHSTRKSSKRRFPAFSP